MSVERSIGEEEFFPTRHSCRCADAFAVLDEPAFSGSFGMSPAACLPQNKGLGAAKALPSGSLKTLCRAHHMRCSRPAARCCRFGISSA